MHLLTLTATGYRDLLEAAKIVQDAADAAAKACEKAGVKTHSASIVARTAEEAGTLIGKRTEEGAQLSIRHCDVLMHGLGMMKAGVDKLADRASGDFFAATGELNQRSSELADLRIVVEDHARLYAEQTGFDFKELQAGEGAGADDDDDEAVDPDGDPDRDDDPDGSTE